MAADSPPANPARPPASLREGPKRLLLLYFVLVVALAALPFLLHFGFAVDDEAVFTKQTQPAWGWPLLEKDLAEFYAIHRRWPSSLEEFYYLGKKWAQDPNTRQTRIRRCRAAPCTALNASNYLYLYQALPNGAAAVWMLPQARLPSPLPYSYRAKPGQAREQALLWQAQAPAYFAACRPGARCRLWCQPGLAPHEKERPLGRSALTPQIVMGQFQPTTGWLEQEGFSEISPAIPTPK